MKRTATDLRAHLYEVLDQVAKTGEPVEIVRNGVELRIVRADSKMKARPKKKAPRVFPDAIIGDPDAIIHMEWPWSQGRDL